MNAIAPAIKPVLLVNSTQAASIAILAQSPLPVIVSPFAPANQAICVDTAAFASLLGAVDFAVSEEAELHMSDAPLPLATGPQGSAVLAAPSSSMWQQAWTAMRSIIDVDWALRRPNAVSFISSVTW